MKQKGKIRILSKLLAALLLFTGCSVYDLDFLDAPSQNVQNVEDGMISGRRTGILRQGISGQFKTFEVTNERVYFMANIDGLAMLYAMEHDSDTLEPLCPLEGCAHDGMDCGAYFGTSGNVCYYDDALFVSAGTRLYRMNPDGSDRVQLLDVKDMEPPDDQVKYNGIAEAKLWNGVFTFYAFTYGKELAEEAMNDKVYFAYYQPYYYLLDGSMSKPLRMEQADFETGSDPIAQYNDGENFIMRGPGLAEKADQYYLYTWNPQSNRCEWFADVSTVYARAYEPAVPVPSSQQWLYNFQNSTTRRYEAYGEGYWGKECAYYLETEKDKLNITTNKLCQLDYASGKPKYLLDTGLEGSYKLACFPDCFVLIETVNNDMKIPETPMLYIYNWGMEMIGQCKLDYERGILPQDVICGETAGRIYLAAHFTGVPEYYIEKDELKGEEIPLHSLSYENFDPAQSYAKWMDIRDAGIEKWQEMWNEIMEIPNG